MPARLYRLSDDQKRTLYRKGFVVVKGAVAPELVEAARARIKRANKGENLFGEKEMTDLVNASSVTPILREALGTFDPPTASQVGVIPKRTPHKGFNFQGYRDEGMPYHGAELHAEGSITMAAVQEVQQGTPDEIYRRYIASGPKGDIGRSADVTGINMGSLFQDPEMTLSLGSFNAFVFVSLSDQMKEGCGQTVVLPGSHHALERFYRWQYETNGCMGPEGPGWPRLDHDVPNRCGLVYVPDAVREQFVDEACECTPDGRRWPRPTPILMEPGDACIAMYHMVHSGSRNENGSESRKSIIFRIRNKRRQPNVVVNGVSDHPDRGQFGEWLEFEPGNDPWARSKHAMRHMWDEWEGMQAIAAQERSLRV
jgi:hypothetical protein